MPRVLDRLPLLPFRLNVRPSASELGRACEQDARAAAVFLFRFGDATASHRVDNVWVACCEIFLQAQLVRQAQLHSFSLNGEQLFEISYFNDAAVCSWSPEHVFAVDKREAVDAFESFVQQVLAASSDHRCEHFVHLGASLVLTQPRFRVLNEVN